MPLTLSAIGKDYLDALRYEQGCSKCTFATYQAWIHNYSRWLVTQGKPDDLTSYDTPTLRTFLYSLQQRDLRPRTIRSAFNPLRGLARYMVSHGLMTEDPALPLKLPKKDAANRALTNEGEIKALLAAAKRIYPERRAILADAMLKTLIFSGVRFQEWLDIKVADVRLHDGSILVAHGKGEKARTVYPPAECMDAIRAWIGARGTKCKYDWLWMPYPSRRMGELGTRDLLGEIKAIAGLEGHDNIRPHSLRHAFATRMMNNGAPLTTIQAALGHSSPVITSGYLHLGEQQARGMSVYASQKPTEKPAEQLPVKQSPHKTQKAAEYTRQRRATGRADSPRR